MIGALRRALLSAVGRAGALSAVERAGLLATFRLQHAAPLSELEQRIEHARRRLKAAIPPPES